MGTSSTHKFDSMIPATKYPSSRRTPSFSSSASSTSTLSSSLGSSYFQDESPLSPVAPVRFSGVPFSWERLPGIPKKLQNHRKKESVKLLPLPPPATPPTCKKNSLQNLLTWKKTPIANTASAAVTAAESFRKDPFFTALVECSKDDGDDEIEEEESRSKFKISAGAKIGRSISDRFGFINLYSCCKRSCSVSESIVYLPKSTSRTANYGLINRRPR